MGEDFRVSGIVKYCNMRFTIAGKELANIRLILMTGIEIDVIAWEFNATDITEKFDYITEGNSLYIVFIGYMKERSWNNFSGELIVREYLTVKRIGQLKVVTIKYSPKGEIVIQ